jgi:hypothetical protein
LAETAARLSFAALQHVPEASAKVCGPYTVSAAVAAAAAALARLNPCLCPGYFNHAILLIHAPAVGLGTYVD